MLNIILIDDELNARLALRYLLDECVECNIIGEAESMAQAQMLLNSTRPDIVFLDVELKDGTAFELLSRFPKPSFEVVFVTGHDEFALKAFQYNALDYILKPISLIHLERVLNKIRLHQRPQDDFHKQLQTLMHTMQNGKHEKLVLSTSDGMHFLPLSEIIYLKSEGNYTTVFTEKKQHIMVSQNLGAFDYLDAHTEGSNPPESSGSGGAFFRTHQSFIVNLKAVHQFLKHEDGDFAVMNDNTKIPIARRKKEAFLEAMMMVNK